MKASVMRRFHFLAFSLVVSVAFMAGHSAFTGKTGTSTVYEAPQTGRYIYSQSGNSSSDITDHCGGLSFQKCCQYERDHSPGLWIFFYILALLYIFLAVAIVCDDYFVPSLELLSERLDLSEDVAGATFMAAGSSAPELFTSLASVTAESDVGVGTIVGSAVFNILVIISLTAALTTTDLHLDWRPLVRDSVFYGFSIILFLIFVEDGKVMYWESSILLLCYILYCVVMKYNRHLMAWMARVQGRVQPSNDIEASTTEAAPAKKAGTDGDVQHPSVRQGFTEDTEAAPITRSHSSVRQSMTSPVDGEEKRHFQHHSKTDEKVRTSLIRRASEIGDIIDKLEKPPQEKAETNLTDIVEANDFKVKQMAFDTAKKDHNSVVWGLFSGVLMIDRPEKNEEKPGFVASCMYGYEWFVYVLSVPLYFLFSHTIPECSRLDIRKYYVLSFIMSMVWIACLTISMVILVEKMGCILGLSLFIMGLFLVAAGTSIPDAMSSIIVAREGFADMAVSNAIGSNIFDINLGLGLPFIVKAIWQASIGEEASVNLLNESEKLRYDEAQASGTFYMVPHVQFGIILLGILLVTLATFAFFKFRLSRPLGLAFFGMYIIFFIYGMIKEFVCYDGSGISC